MKNDIVNNNSTRCPTFKNLIPCDLFMLTNAMGLLSWNFNLSIHIILVRLHLQSKVSFYVPFISYVSGPKICKERTYMTAGSQCKIIGCILYSNDH